jgi:acetylornithine deacetylase/succinyl-diaminopimelate desuccinylase-like protein
VGTIRGGEKVNIVPASCVVEVDRRTIPEESKEDVIASIDAAVDRARETYPDIDAAVELEFFARPFEVDETSNVVAEMTKAVSEVTGRDAELAGFRGASDARFLAEGGATVLVCGPGDISVAHTARESIDLTELEQGALAYALAFARLLGDPDG